SQGVADANETIAALKKYGFGTGSFSYLDIEWYARTKACDNIVIEFTDAWTERLHAAGYKSGLYSSGSAAIKAMDEARIAKRAGLNLPDQMWIAWTNKLANTDGGAYLSDAGWANHQRIHQYQNGVDVTYGGYKLNIDRDYLDVGKGSVAPRKVTQCGVNVTFSSYPKLMVGSRGSAVSALQCMLIKRGFTTSVNGAFGVSTRKALEAFRKSRGWAPKSYTTRPTWTALLSAGTKPRVLKQGSVGESVWRLQRSLVAAGLTVTPNGLYDAKTVAAVKAFRKKQGLPQYSTTESTVWTLLQRGKTG
ncbi:MAG: glycoside hydrolase domain-containing protein, partial [Aeromicrobium sp.]